MNDGGGGVAGPCGDVAGVVLAGGLARRMGGRHKAFLELGGKPLIGHVLERLRPQVAHVAISANEQGERLRGLSGVEAVLPDPLPGHVGPLAGILAGMSWLREEHPDVPWLLSVAVDTPFFPADLCARLRAAVDEEGAEMAVACSGGRMHPVFGLWPVHLAEALRQALRQPEMHKVARFASRFQVAMVSFDRPGRDPFFNINTWADLRALKEEEDLAIRRLRRHDAPGNGFE